MKVWDEVTKQGLASSYHDSAAAPTLRKFIGDQAELDRLNRWRGENVTMAEFNEMLTIAINAREAVEGKQ